MRVLIELTVTTTLLMHNVRLADKANELTKAIAEITAKKTNRTEADDVEIERLEFMGGLYHDPVLGPYIPTANLVRCFENAAKVVRQGTNVVRAFAVTTDRVALQYDGPRKPVELWAKPLYHDRRLVGIQRGKVIRVRPCFRQWRLTVEAELMEDVMSLDMLTRIVQSAGRMEGLGDARKLGYGRFTAEIAADDHKHQTAE